MKQIILLVIVFLIGCSQSESYTLYRNSIADEFERIHVASFNAKEGEKYNQEKHRLLE